MRVKIGNYWHYDTQEPICIQLSNVERERIGSMTSNSYGKYFSGPDTMRRKEIEDFMEYDDASYDPNKGWEEIKE